MADLPVFRSQFLNHIAERLANRRKALKRHGELAWETQQPDDFEWLTVNFTPLVGNYCVFQFIEDNRVNVFVRSKTRHRRGRVLLAIKDITIVNNARRIVDAVEATIGASEFLELNNLHNRADGIRDAWSRLEVRIAKEGKEDRDHP